MFHESSTATKVVITIGIGIYVVVLGTIYYPVTVITLLTEMLDYVWNTEPQAIAPTK
jgi:hypothetical protein